MCEHLKALDDELTKRGIAETFRGKAWSRNCREWAYFSCYLDLPAIRSRLKLAACVVDHMNDDRKSGTELGFCCSEHFDAVMGKREPSDKYLTVR